MVCSISAIDERKGSDALAVVRPTGVYLFDFFCSGIQFYVLLSPYICFISFLYLDLYVFGDDALISQGSFMQTKHICVLIHILIKGEDGAVKLVQALQLNIFTDRPKAILLLWTICVLRSHAFASVHCCIVVTCWERTDLLTLVGDFKCIFVTFPCGILGQVWYLTVSFSDLCHLSYFYTCNPNFYTVKK